MTPAEIIARSDRPDIRRVIIDAIVDHGMEHPSPRDIADLVCERISAAGYRILGPDEYDPVTIEAAAKIAESDADWSRFGKAEIHEAWQGGADAAREYRIGIVSGRAIASRIRAMEAER